MSKYKKDSAKKSRLDLKTETKKGILGVFLILITLISVLSYFKVAGPFGEYFYSFFNALFGVGYFLIPLALGLGSIAILKTLHEDIYGSTFLGMGIFILSFLAGLHLLAYYPDVPHALGGGGYIGFIVALPLWKIFRFWVSFIIVCTLVLISLLITFNLSLKKLFSWKIFKLKEETKIDKPALYNDNDPKDVFSNESDNDIDFQKKNISKPMFKVSEVSDRSKDDDSDDSKQLEKISFDDIDSQPSKSSKSYHLPPIDLVEEDKGEPNSGDIKTNANIIKRTLENFGIEVEMAEVNIGPTVTQYTLRPAQGIKLSKITALGNDLALSLAAHPIRIEAPIPGRSLVGVEIPNKTVTKVRMKNLLASQIFRDRKTNLPLAVGRDVAGNPVIADIDRMPHLLVAGATGTGKTVCLNAILTSLLSRNTPETLRLILVDPKRVEFAPYSNIPHLLTPVILGAEKTVNALRWAVAEMERRFGVLSEAGSRDIISYNQKIKQRGDEPTMPYIVIVVDELADLMATYGRDVEAGIVRLAQMARAVGIHLIVATQRPSVEVITGLIKANITTRIAFQVASQIDSRTILDMAGAEKLLGNGDLLFLSAESSKPRRVQGVFISEKEVKSITDFWKSEGSAEYDESVLQAPQNASGSLMVGADGEGSDDELYNEAKKIVIEAGKASASFLQRRLRVGYARAARLLDMLEANGIIGPGDGAKPRDIMVGKEEIL